VYSPIHNTVHNTGDYVTVPSMEPGVSTALDTNPVQKLRKRNNLSDLSSDPVGLSHIAHVYVSIAP